MVLVLAACSPNPNGQGVAEFGSVQGRVVDAKTQQPVQQFTVSVGGQSVSVSPAAQGVFLVNHVPIGTQTLQVFAIGYQTFVLPGIVVQKDQTTNIDQLIGIAPTSGL